MVQYNLKKAYAKNKDLKKVVDTDEYIRFPQELKDKYELEDVPHPALNDAHAPLVEESPLDGAGGSEDEPAA